MIQPGEADSDDSAVLAELHAYSGECLEEVRRGDNPVPRATTGLKLRLMSRIEV